MIEKIRNCNTDNDYVFVSYSKTDKDKVYPLIVKLQEQGCNIWIDKELNSAIGEDWQHAALTAITQQQCKALLFMVSKNSLTSAPVFSELVWSQKSNKVLKHHNREPLKIVPINVDETWSPTNQGITDWINTEVATDTRELTEPDYACMRATGYIDKKYYEVRSINRLEDKGDISQLIYDDVLKNLGGSRITIADIDDIDTILKNIPDTVFTSPSEQTKTPNVQKTNAIEKTLKKSATLTGDITYTLYGNTYTENQSNMMLRIFAQVLNHHQEIVPELCDYNGMNCVSKINYKLEENKENMPSYFRVCEYFEYPTGNICVGTAYSFSDKCKKIALLLNICGESNDILISEQIELPEIKCNAEKSTEPNTGLKKGSDITYTVYGETFTTNQADMLKTIGKKLLEKHPEKLAAATEETYFISLTDYTNVPKEQRPVYYRSMSTETINSHTISIGTTFNKQAKIAEVAKLMGICSEESGTVTIDGEIITPKPSSNNKPNDPFALTHFFS